MSNLRIIFMGTPEFAIPTLDILLRQSYNVVAVITSVDKLGGRGKKQILQSAVKKYADSKNLKVLQPSNLKASTFVEELKSLKADLQIVVAFRMLPEIVWNMPRLGTYNLHGSLLPKYRGAAPINWAIANGEKTTGMTTFKLKHEIDTGNVVHQNEIPIHHNDSAGSLHDKLMHIGAELVLRTVQDIESETVSFIPQDEQLVSKAPKIYHNDLRINFNAEADVVRNFIRAMNPYPAAWTTLENNGQKLKIFSVRIGENCDQSTPGLLEYADKKHLRIATKDFWLYCEDVQLEGKRRMNIKEFMNGFRLS